MYFKAIKQVLEQAIADYMELHNVSRKDVLTTIRAKIDDTQSEHYKHTPDIDYDDPLCRLGYLYRHAGINATFFEEVLSSDEVVSEVISSTIATGRLTVCSLGGGPGTELLGLTKHLLKHHKAAPSRIDFQVLDNVNNWAETWDQLSNAAEDVLESELSRGRPIVVPKFLQFNVLDPSSYTSLPSMFKKVGIIVCN